jgi:hypothetical protein
MKKVAEDRRAQTLRQIDAMLFHRIIPEHHIPVFHYIRAKIERDEAFEDDAHILIYAYRQFLRGAHLREFNKNHPTHRKGKRHVTEATRAKLRKAHTGKKYSAERVAKMRAGVIAANERTRKGKEE